MAKVSLVIPYIDQLDKLQMTIRNAEKYATPGDVELILIDNGSAEDYDEQKHLKSGTFFRVVKQRFDHNIGVLPTYKAALGLCTTDIICYIHSDVLIHQTAWNVMIDSAFSQDELLGLAGFFGARGVGTDGGRDYSMSNMQGSVWGKCDCHPLAAHHHGTHITSPEAAGVLDGLAMIFRRSCLEHLIHDTDAFDEWRSPHHFYDKILSMKCIDLGYHLAVIPVGFDHYSGATANHSETYKDTMNQWLEAHGHAQEGDHGIYKLAEQQMFQEFGGRLPLRVAHDHSNNWRQG